MSKDHRILIPGMCRVCGCTSETACPGGCTWVDAEMTLCSLCAAREEIAWLSEANETFVGLDPDDDAFARAMADELERVGTVELNIHAYTLITLIEAAQLGLRHPHAGEQVKAVLAPAFANARAMFHKLNCPATAEAIVLGCEGTGCTPDGDVLTSEL